MAWDKRRIAIALLKTAALVVLVAGSFAYGVATLRFKIFPYSVLRDAKRATANGGHDPAWQAKVDIFARIRSGDVVMLGDSITEWADWDPASLPAGVRVTNQGIGGDTTEGILDRVDVTLGSRPRKICLMAGLNDLYSGRSVDEAFDTYVEILDRIHQKGGDVCVQSILFTSAYHLRDLNPSIVELNRRLKEHCRTRQIPFIDLNATLAPDGLLADAYSFDGCHLNGEGCVKWSECLRPYLDAPAPKNQ